MREWSDLLKQTHPNFSLEAAGTVDPRQPELPFDGYQQTGTSYSVEGIDSPDYSGISSSNDSEIITSKTSSEVSTQPSLGNSPDKPSDKPSENLSAKASDENVENSEELSPKVKIESQTSLSEESPESVEKSTAPIELEWISPTQNLSEKIANIPDRMAFKIGEAAEYVGVKGYVLRYWESEFDSLKPKKSKNGQRMYSQKDVESALLIKKLLHEDRFSVEGARSALKKLKKQMREGASEPSVETSPKKTDSTSALISDSTPKTVEGETSPFTQGDLFKAKEAILEAINLARQNLGV